MQDTLIIGYGNADREDDGVAWHVLNYLALGLDRPTSTAPEDGFEPAGQGPELLFVLQLTPELAETLAQYRRVCFIDAHTGSIPEDLMLAEVPAEYQTSPFTHHMTASTCLALCRQLYGKQPHAILVSIRGYRFGFSRQLSSETASLARQAAEKIWAWLTTHS